MSSTPSPAEIQIYFEKLQALSNNLPDLDQPNETDTEATAALEQDVKKLDVREKTLEDKVDAYCQEFLYIGGPAPPRHRRKKEDKTPI
jgi:hypothetical protein